MKVVLCVTVITLLVFQSTPAAMVGGWSDVSDVNSPEFQKLVSLASDHITKASNSAYIMTPVETLNARKQVVAGMKYKFTLRMAATECKKNKSDNVDISECKPLKCGPIERCEVVVWDKPWEDDGTKVLENTCQREPKSTESC